MCGGASWGDLAWQGMQADGLSHQLDRVAATLAGLERLAPGSLDCAGIYSDTVDGDACRTGRLGGPPRSVRSSGPPADHPK